ncbi:hypothetical protein ZWY2020_015391 [Hordeum vulgare]|nr:hypothetical protein ZWY2020_051922 [Hordeum vulgare]KAI4978638.1 hypothetical protein ZWY2020_015391 [Hordeum vulgare]
MALEVVRESAAAAYRSKTVGVRARLRFMRRGQYGGPERRQVQDSASRRRASCRPRAGGAASWSAGSRAALSRVVEAAAAGVAIHAGVRVLLDAA